MRTICEQIRDAFERSGLTVAELVGRSGLKLERSTLQRKLTGHAAMRTTEAEALARVLGLSLVCVVAPLTSVENGKGAA